MNLTKKQIISIGFLLILVFALPVAIFLTKRGLDIRPRALQGQANMLLSADSTSIAAGKPINVVVSMQLKDNNLKASGVDFVLLYEKSKLDVLSVTPQIKSIDPAAAFTEAPIVSTGGVFDDTFNFIRVVEVARVADQYLPTGTVTLAKINFVARTSGNATVKFPDDNKYIQISGIGGSTPSVTPGGPSVTSVPASDSAGTANLSIVPAQATINLNAAPQTYTLQATFPSGTASQKLNSFKGEINFPNNLLQMPSGQYVDTSASGFNSIVRVDGPTQANTSGKIVIRLGLTTPGTGSATNAPITIATFKLAGKAVSSAGGQITLGNIEITDNLARMFSVTTQPANFSVTQ